MRSTAIDLLECVEAATNEARSAYNTAVRAAVQQQLANMPVDKLKDVSQGRLHLNAMKRAGYRTVHDVWEEGYSLSSVPGIGETTANHARSAAFQLMMAVEESTRLRFNVDEQPAEQTHLLTALRQLEHVTATVQPLTPRLETLVQAVDADFAASQLQTQSIRRLFSSRQTKQASAEALHRLTQLANDPATWELDQQIAQAQERLATGPVGPPDVWNDYRTRSIRYNSLLIDIGGLEPEAEKAEGYLEDDQIARIRSLALDTNLLTASLRGYQAFGAKFALAQGRTILGDEMGLGKTLEALAMICHLRSEGATHFLVVCPASVLTNWEQEIRRHTRLDDIRRLHGQERGRQLGWWAEQGGVALTTFGTLGSMDIPAIDLAATIVDEAHLAKNPEAKRTQAVRAWLQHSQRALLMSGTPMENRVDEFITLVSHINPPLSDTIIPTVGLAGPEAFRRAVAPVYLRRNQEDVLSELPEMIETADWMPLGKSSSTYADAVEAGNFMAMRRAAFMTPRPEDSPKISRLMELIEDATANGRKVIVFSYFRDVIARVDELLGPMSAGVIHGGVTAPNRQLLIDRFTADSEPKVLVSQIDAGGVGLNIQAASVVILVEPQWKPSTEVQAIARCHRMGQVEVVQVHRLLTLDSVDELMVEILGRKAALFAGYARESHTKDANLEAIDITDQASTLKTATQATREHRIVELERQRLGAAIQ
jgi:superfamily II DNA or RNA helicase